MRRFDVIFCNLPSNMDYTRRHYDVRPEQDIRWTPLWTDVTPVPRYDRREMRAKYGIPDEGIVAVFGGQIIEGRGIEQMLKAARRAREAGSRVTFLFVGDGRLTPLVEQEVAASGSNVLHLRQMPRTEYLALLSGCDIGLAVTVAGVSSFSFPTKSMDYLRAGIPVVASVEEGSDFAKILLDHGVGVSVELGDEEGFFRAVDALARDDEQRRSMADRTQACLDEVFDVRHGYRRLMEAIEGSAPDGGLTQAANEMESA